jgi:hypothetical protein
LSEESGRFFGNGSRHLGIFVGACAIHSHQITFDLQNLQITSFLDAFWHHRDTFWTLFLFTIFGIVICQFHRHMAQLQQLQRIPTMSPLKIQLTYSILTCMWKQKYSSLRISTSNCGEARASQLKSYTQ